MSQFSRHELDERWRQKLCTARQRYEEASDAFRIACEEHLGTLPTSDSTFAIAHARKVESAAMAEYMRILKIFTDLLLYGKAPEEPPPH